MIDPNVILFANEAFYAACNNGDIDAMDRLWARQTRAVCIHPGWRALTTREDIIQSWRDIFSNQQMQIECHEPVVVFQPEVFSVVCYEQLPQGWLVATNSFVLEDGEPRMCHHQAGQCMDPPQAIERPVPQ